MYINYLGFDVAILKVTFVTRGVQIVGIGSWWTREITTKYFTEYIMKKIFYLLWFMVLFVNAANAKGQAPANYKFSTELRRIIYVANKPSGFDSLKHTELSTGIWNSRLELDGFLPLVELDPIHPADKHIVTAVSVTPAAHKNIKLLLLKGLPGYVMKDSQTDKSVALNTSTEARKVIYKREDKFVTSTVTIVFKAHEYNSIKITIESW